ncbi:MAG: ATP-binding cassette domain-containing protein [Caulobacteraceae bacterium]|nr:ATP-binding cassette domain-containing protein [Caulobacteraceae bacterium]
MTSALILSGLGKSFDSGRTWAVRDLSLEVAKGEFLALIGGSGSGKTTLLKMINRLIEPDAGEVRIDGALNTATPAPELRRGIGYVFQGAGLFPHMTLAENVAVTPRLLGWSEAEITARVAELMDLVELPVGVWGDRLPTSLSGGQRQRVAFARALAARPSLVLMDEPFGALDAISRDGIAEAYRRLHDQLGLTTVMVTHDVNEALLTADRLGVMKEGRLVASGPPAELMGEGADPYVHDLLEAPRRQAARIASKFGGAHG